MSSNPTPQATSSSGATLRRRDIPPQEKRKEVVVAASAEPRVKDKDELPKREVYVASRDIIVPNTDHRPELRNTICSIC